MINSHSSRQSAINPASRIYGIVVALPEEIATLTRQKLAQGKCARIAENILLDYAGAGPLNAERSARRLIGLGASHLISWGCAAALSPELKPGDLVLAEHVVSEEGHSLASDEQWTHRLRKMLPSTLRVVNGGLAESRQIVAASTAKKRIHSQTGAMALDMESAAVARVAAEANLPCLVIRAIADPVDMDLPQAVANSLNDQGRVELAKLLRFLLSHPGEIPALVKLGLHFGAAQKTLKTVAKQLGEITHF